jgi:hypothetical protein
MAKSSLASLLGQNLAMNPLLDIWTRGTSFPAIANLTYFADRWRLNRYSATTAVVTASRSGNVPDGSLASFSMRVEVTTANSGVTTSEHMSISQPIEGYFARRVYGRKSAMGFYFRTNKIGQYSVSVRNALGTMAFVKKFTPTSANVWEFVEIKVPRLDSTAATWEKTSLSGIELQVKLVEGRPTGITPNDGVWQAGNYQAITGQVNFAENIGNYVEMTEFQYVEGHSLYEASEIMRDIDVETHLNKRYYEVVSQQGSGDPAFPGRSSATTLNRSQWYFEVEKRVNPSMSVSGGTTYVVATSTGSLAVSSLAFTSTSVRYANLFSTIAGATLGAIGNFTLQTGSILADAEIY